jgi:hypothetical protein
MKNLKLSGFLKTMGFLALITLTSCSRGYGCPYDFSVTRSVLKLLAICFEALTSLF